MQNALQKFNFFREKKKELRKSFSGKFIVSRVSLGSSPTLEVGKTIKISYKVHL